MTLPNFTGPGYLGGESPDGLTTVAGVPIAARVDVLWRDPADPDAQDVLVQTTQAAPDGTWQITDVNPDLDYVIRGTKNGFDDVTVVGARPVRTDVLIYESSLQSSTEMDGVVGDVRLESGVPPFSASVIGLLPSGLEPVLVGRRLIIEGVSEDEGSWSPVLRITDRNGVHADVAFDLQIAVPFDEYWSNVLVLLHLDGDIYDETLRVWTASTTAAFVANAGVGGSGAISSAIQTAYAAALDVINGDFTIEFFVKADDWATWGFANSLGSLSIAFGKMTPAGVSNYWSVGPNGQGRVAFYAWNNGAQILRVSTGIVPTGTLTHVSVMRFGNRLLVSIAGVVEDLGNVGSINLGPNTPFSVGRYNSQQRVGLQDELRITKGVARYTENFVPPSKPFLSR